MRAFAVLIAALEARRPPKVVADAAWEAFVEQDMPKGATHMTAHLDLLVDEPLELAIALRKLSEGKTDNPHTGKQWSKFAEAMIDLVAGLKALNEPGDRE